MRLAPSAVGLVGHAVSIEVDTRETGTERTWISQPRLREQDDVDQVLDTRARAIAGIGSRPGVELLCCVLIDVDRLDPARPQHVVVDASDDVHRFRSPIQLGRGC